MEVCYQVLSDIKKAITLLEQVFAILNNIVYQVHRPTLFKIKQR